jgi:hypothetical protein
LGHLFWPEGEGVEARKKLFSILRDAKIPLQQLTLLHKCPAAPRPSLLVHLLVGENSAVHGVPVHPAGSLRRIRSCGLSRGFETRRYDDDTTKNLHTCSTRPCLCS